MRARRLFSLPSMTPFLLSLLKRPWHWLLLLLVGTPLVWATDGVSINNLVITTVKQLSFAQAKAEVNVNQQFTQTATVRLSPGAVTYRSSDTAVATVNAQTGQVSGVLAGEATITANQAAAAPYPAAGASYTIKVKGLPVAFQPWQLASVMYGMPAFQIAAPVSNVQNATFVYRLKDPATTVASITEAGLVTVKAVGKTTIVATQKASGTFDSGTIEADLEVMAVPGLNDRELPYGTDPIDLLPQLGGQNVAYSSSATAVATIIGTSGQPQVSLKGLGSTVLEAKNAAGVVLAKATWKVVAGQPTLTVDPVPPLPSTTFETTLRARSGSAGPFTFSIPDPTEANEIAEVNPTTGQLWVKGPGTVQVKVSQAANGPWAARDILVPVTIEDGLPGIVITRSPTAPLKQGDTFSIGYRTNFMGGQVGGYVYSGNNYQYADLHFSQVSQTPPAGLGQEGSIVFRVEAGTVNGVYRFLMATVVGPFFPNISSMDNIPALTREIVVDGPALPKRFNLGAPLTMVYGDKPEMPRSYDQSGAEITDNNRCTGFYVEGNGGILAGIDTGPVWDKDSWRTIGVGQTVIACGETILNRSAVLDYDPVVVTVIGADPRLQGFPSIEIGMDASAYPLYPPASLNSTGTWTYAIVDANGQPSTAARINNSGATPQIEPLAPSTGPVFVRATQAASGNFREASIQASLTVSSAQSRSFLEIKATYGDPDFLIPRPQGAADNVSFTYEALDSSQDVFQIVNNTTLHILNANTDASGNVTQTAAIRATSTDGSIVVTGQVIVAKATPRLMFYVPRQVFPISACGVEWTWPIANQGADNTVKGTLITNSDGALYYPMGTVPGWGGITGPNPDGRYWNRLMGSSVYVESEAPWLPAWVQQSESRNFKGARSETVYYSLWARDNVAWQESIQEWRTSCDH
jgi:hypothetical protein